MVTKFKVTPEGYKYVLWEVANLWERATVGGPGHAPTGTMRECIGHIILQSNGCVGVEHRK